MDWNKTADVVRLISEFAQEYNVPVCTLIHNKTKKTISPTKGTTKKKIQEIFISGRDEEGKKFIAMRELQKRLDNTVPGEFLVRVDKGESNDFVVKRNRFSGSPG